MSTAAHPARALIRSGCCPPPPHTMRCLEVWGGTDAVDHGVVMPGLDAWLYSRPYNGHAAGGDIHFVSSCAAGLVTRALVADVSGHGNEVSGVADALRTLMGRYVNYIDQTRLVEALNQEFGALSVAGGFATAVVATYLAPESRLAISNAGHPRPLRYDARARAWTLLDSSRTAVPGRPVNIPLGVAAPTSYDETHLTLGPSDVVVLYTDALIDARGDGAAPLGEGGLLRLVSTLDPSDPAELMRALIARVRPVGDDVTVLVMRRNALVSRPSLATMAAAQARLLARVVRGIFNPQYDIPWPDAGLLARLRHVIDRG